LRAHLTFVIVTAA